MGGIVLGYTELNTLLVERFGDLERLCNQIYETHHGVTSYINHMESLSFKGSVTVSDWNYNLERLKEVRHKRNKLSHGEVSFNEIWANEDDINFVADFRNGIMNQTDPIALYYKYNKQSKSKGDIPDAQKVNTYSKYPNNATRNGSAGCLTLIASFLIIVVGVIAFLL